MEGRVKKLSDCPHCGKTNEVYRNVRACGWCEEHFDEHGDQTSIETDGLYFTRSQKFYCLGCGKRRTNLVAEGNKLRLANKPPSKGGDE